MTITFSPFLHAGSNSTADNLAIIHLRRDLLQPTILRERDDDCDGYDEGKVINTRFGSFPHKTLIDVPWGSQVRASLVDTGSRGRRDTRRKKVEPERASEQLDGQQTPKEAVTAASGFIHLLPPTPENWTTSLPHRTQVVYTPDYSYILHQIRARPGTSLIEAGAGSGSFTHASTRAVYSGYPSFPDEAVRSSKKRKLGKVWSYEFHEQRHEKLVRELEDHRLDGIVEITHRDVCRDGFLVSGQSPDATAVFLDLPAPWLALPHLSRSNLHEKAKTNEKIAEIISHIPAPTTPFIPAVNPKSVVRICTFSPCIEQVQRTISAMRHLGWVDIEMVEIANKRIEVRRERVGIAKENEGFQSSPATVEEAVAKLRENESHAQKYQNGETGETTADDLVKDGEASSSNAKESLPKKQKGAARQNPNSRAKLLENLIERKVYKEGNLVHRAEQELKTHTSYLVFAVLPIEWNEEDEARARAKFPVREKGAHGDGAEAAVNGTKRKRNLWTDPDAPPSKRQLKKAERAARKEREAKDETGQDSKSIPNNGKSTEVLNTNGGNGAKDVEMADA